MNLLEQQIGKIARDVAGATGVFHKFGLDFCCGGSKSLAVMIAEKGIDDEQILSELQMLIVQGQSYINWKNEPSSIIVTHIRDRYHETHRRQLPELIRLADRVEDVHSNHPECPTGLSSKLKKMHGELEIHMKEEEDDLFPMILKNKRPEDNSIIDDLQIEHTSHGLMLEEIEQIANGFVLPNGACNTWQALYKGLNVFKVDLMDHIHLENNILFDRIKEGV